MKIQPLYDLQQEINRLCIAGSKFAKEDPRLKKLAPVFEKLSEKAPVFKKIASDIQALAAADSREAADKLMALSTLLYSILYTQGEEMAEGHERKPQSPLFALEQVNTSHSYAQLKILRELSEARSGRLEILQNAFAGGLFDDFRAWIYLDLALGDKYAELADYVADVVIPKVGRGVLPFMLRSFRHEDKAEQARRLRAMSNFDFPEMKDILDKIYSENLVGLQVAGISALAMNPANEDFLVKLSEDKNKKVREAAYEGLLKIGSPKGAFKLKELFLKCRNNSSMEILARLLAGLKGSEFFDELFQAAEKTFAGVVALQKEGKPAAGVLTEALDKLSYSLMVLKNKPDERVPQFLLRAVSNPDYQALVKANEKDLFRRHLSSYTQRWVLELMAIEIMESYPDAQAMAFYAECARTVSPDQKNPFWPAYLSKAVSILPKEKVFDIFSPAFQKGLLDIDELLGAFGGQDLDLDGRYDPISVEKMDYRWSDLFYGLLDSKNPWRKGAYSALRLLHACEPRDSGRFEDLLRSMEPTDDYFFAAVARLWMIFERELPDRFELIYSYVTRHVNRNFQYYLGSHRGNMWKSFPLEYAAKFRAEHEKTKNVFLEGIAGEIEDR